jgi:uncharacterized protein YndB with AHSA1/START domain
MRSVHVTRTIPAPAEAVFDILADHAHYDRFRPIHASELLREGDPAHGGSIRLHREGEATHVDWRSSFTVPIPVVGQAIEVPWLMTLRRGFHRVLEDIKRMLA